MSKFEVVRSNDGVTVMYTEDSSCITKEEVECLASAGYKFKLDGKIISKQAVKDYACGEETKSGKEAKSVEENTEHKGSRIKVVLCVTTGETFKNQSLAAKRYSIDPAQVSDSIKTGRPRSGYVFEYVYQ